MVHVRLQFVCDIDEGRHPETPPNCRPSDTSRVMHSCCCMDNWNSNALFRDRDEQRQMGIQSAKDRTRYSMGNHRRRRSTVECSREVSGRALRRNSNREDGCNSACASIPEPGLSVSPSPPGRGQGEGHKIRIDLRPSPGASRRPLPEGEAYKFSISTGWIWSETVKPK